MLPNSSTKRCGSRARSPAPRTTTTARRAAEFRPRIEPIVDRLLDDLAQRAAQADDGAVDLLLHFARPLPVDVICELVGIPEADRPLWREWGAAVATGWGQAFADAIPHIMAGAKAAVALRRAEPADDLISELVQVRDTDGDRLGETELVTLVWHLVLAGQTPTNLVANAVQTLLTHPGQLAVLRREPDLMPRAVEELTRWSGPQLMTIPRYAREDVEIAGVLVGKGEPVTAVIAAANRDPRVFTDPETLDLSRPAETAAHLGYAHGPHFCLGAALARTQTEVALTRLLDRFPGLALADTPTGSGRLPDPGTWRLATLPVTI
ncbi:cytochrome P450 [Micromonospora sp. NPDC049523]|uniref:cytochrome P450 n=1 Tax=Micromonospora sp. NPDC049523 TaxID=3155921 RepID=UPI00342F0B1E